MDGDNLKLKYIIKKSIRIQMRQCRVFLIFSGSKFNSPSTH